MGKNPRISSLLLPLLVVSNPQTNVISTEATDGSIVRCAVERSLYFVFVLAVVLSCLASKIGVIGADRC